MDGVVIAGNAQGLLLWRYSLLCQLGKLGADATRTKSTIIIHQPAIAANPLLAAVLSVAPFGMKTVT